MLLAVLSGPIAASAARAAIGTPVPDREMPTLDGGQARALADVDASVLVFFRAGAVPAFDRALAIDAGYGPALRGFAHCAVRR